MTARFDRPDSAHTHTPRLRLRDVLIPLALLVAASSPLHAADDAPLDARCDQVGWTDELACDIPLTALLVTPAAYDERLVTVTGIAVASEATSSLVLFHTTDAARVLDNTQAVLIDVDSARKVRESLAMLDGETITVRGRFHANAVPLGSSAAGAIDDVRALQVRVDLRKPPKAKAGGRK